MDIKGNLKIKPTCLLKKIGRETWQCFSVDSPAADILTADCAGIRQTWPVSQGQNDVFLPTTAVPREWLFESGERRVPVTQQPVRRQCVHIIQSSHHDLGYTDLPSEVVRQHVKNLEYAVDCTGRTQDYPEEAKFRIVIEQFWSLAAFMQDAPPAKQARMIELLRQGQFEVNALFGNMITEICGSTGLLASLQPAFALAGQYGIPVRCAEHNDIPGFSWGLARALCDAGVVMLSVGFPQYHCWGGMQLPPYWLEEDLLGHPVPGGFWWESPDGKRLLLWTDHGYGYTSSGSLPTLRSDLESFLDQGYPYTQIRYPVKGASMDNAPYIFAYADTVKQWNQEWENPRLILSTNSRFYQAILPELQELPVHRGEVPGQDYPMGSLSLAHTTAQNTRSHDTLVQAEALLALARGLAGVPLDRCLLDQAGQAILCYDEHCFGFHFPCGPAATAAKAEQELFALRAAGWIHAAAEKAKAEIADRLPSAADGQTLVIFNASQTAATGPVDALLREYDNLGQDLHPATDGYLKPAQVAGRWHVSPQNVYLDGAFVLADEAGLSIPFQIDEITSADEPEPYAGQRLGLGSGTRRYGFFENPAGIRKTLRFMAADVPALGWKAYTLKPAAAG
ncbi:MAG TPA: hypothetical protein DD640_01235, partial [Clostridiales bacterium]|nr:hypothetical protein [Clostridiales bacterium]